MISFCKVKLVSFSLTEKLAKHSLGQRRVGLDHKYAETSFSTS